MPLAWSAALRVYQDIFIQTSIEYVALLANPRLLFTIDSQSRAEERVSPLRCGAGPILIATFLRRVLA